MLLKLTKFQKLVIANIPILLIAPDSISSIRAFTADKEYFHKKENFVPITSVENVEKVEEIIHNFQSIIDKKPVDTTSLSKLLTNDVTYKDTLVHLNGRDECLRYFDRDTCFEKYLFSFDFSELKYSVETFISADTLCLVYKPDKSYQSKDQQVSENNQLSNTLLIKLDNEGHISSITNNFLSVPLITSKTTGLVGKASKLFEYKRRFNACLFLSFIGLWNLITGKNTSTSSPTQLALERPKPKKNLEKDI